MASEEVELTTDSLHETELGLDHVFTLDHEVAIGTGRRIYVRESFTLASLLRFPRRSILMAGATPVTGDFYDPPFDGYRASERLARRGFFVFVADQEGSGRSSFPDDGFAVTYASQTDAMRRVVDWIRNRRQVAGVDLVNESIAGVFAMPLCGEPQRVRSCTVASMLYRTGTEFFNAVFNSPEFRAFILGSPNGYLTTVPDTYFNIVAAASPDMATWVRDTMPGPYAAGMLVEDLNTNFGMLDPTGARVPGLVIRGEHDQNVPPSDTEELAAAYGSLHGAGPARLVAIPGGGHAARIEPQPRGQQYWDAVVDFVDP